MLENPVTRIYELQKLRVKKAGGDPTQVDTANKLLQFRSIKNYALNEAKETFEAIEKNEPPKTSIKYTLTLHHNL
jgi:hypothetical protein